MSFCPGNLTTNRLHQFRRRYASQLTHKREVMDRHEPGTSYHTRAKREADEYERRIREIDAELKRREEDG